MNKTLRFPGKLCTKGGIYRVKTHGRYYWQVRFGKITFTRASKDEAERILIGLRYETDRGTFDPRDYQKDQPLSFRNLADKWLDYKKSVVRPGSFRNLNNYMTHAKAAWEDANIKTLGYAEIEDLLLSRDVSNKTRANMKSCLHDFWQWLLRRKVISLDQMPEFPVVRFELGWRRVIDIDTQQRIISAVRELSWTVDPKIYIGLRLLCTYPDIRPAELINILEKDIIYDPGILTIRRPKERHPKAIYLLNEDIELLQSVPRGLPDQFYFRHAKDINRAVAGSQFGPKYLYKWWKKGCAAVGVEGVDLYGGTRHSTVFSLRNSLTPEQIRRGTGHSTNRAFERYYGRDINDARMVYQAARNNQLGSS